MSYKFVILLCSCSHVVKAIFVVHKHIYALLVTRLCAAKDITKSFLKPPDLIEH